MSKQDEQRLLVKIATLYYSENKKQSEIASLLHLSQSFVSRAAGLSARIPATEAPLLIAHALPRSTIVSTNSVGTFLRSAS